jgi:hypothetical protein
MALIRPRESSGEVRVPTDEEKARAETIEVDAESNQWDIIMNLIEVFPEHWDFSPAGASGHIHHGPSGTNVFIPDTGYAYIGVPGAVRATRQQTKKLKKAVSQAAAVGMLSESRRQVFGLQTQRSIRANTLSFKYAPEPEQLDLDLNYAPGTVRQLAVAQEATNIAYKQLAEGLIANQAGGYTQNTGGQFAP